MYVSFETNIRISNFVFEYPNIRIFSEHLNIHLSPNHFFQYTIYHTYTYMLVDADLLCILK